MKKTVVILSSVVGGAVLGSALTMFLAPKTGAEMRKTAHSKIMDQLTAIQEKILSCADMMSGSCKCDEKETEVVKAENTEM